MGLSKISGNKGFLEKSCKMKVLEVIPLLSIDGGAESFVVYFCNELIRQGHECAILMLYNVDDSVLNELSLHSAVHIYTANKKKGLDLACSFNVKSIIKSYKPDIVHVHVGAIPYIALSAICYRKCKYFATIHSEAKREAGSIYAKWTRRFLFKQRFVVPVTISESSRQSFIVFYGVKPEMVYNGVPSFDALDRREEETGIIRFIHVARCHPVKNQVLLLKSFNNIQKKYDNVELNWYGTTDGYLELFESLKSFFNNQIHYMGSTKEARLEMCKSDAFCLSSKMEGMPMTIIEALSVGCIPICTPVGGCTNMIEDGVNGFLAEDMSVEAYTNAMEHFLEKTNDEKAVIKRKAMETFNDKFSIEKTVNDYLALFQQSLLNTYH